LRLSHFLAAAMICATATTTSAQAQTAAQPADSAHAPYRQRGDEVERNYKAYREQLERFFNNLRAHVERDAPDLRAKLLPPAEVPYGYQILPNLLPETPWQPRPTRIVLSPFSWVRTQALINRDTKGLEALRGRLSDSLHTTPADRRADYESIAAEYQKLVAGQKLMASQIQYNRLWQSEVARTPQFYDNARSLQQAALERQELLDSAAKGSERSAILRARVDGLSRRIDEAIKKLPAPEFVKAIQLTPRRWILRVPVYTDIEDSVFIERFRGAIESAWHIRDGEDEFSVTLDIRHLTPSQLYPKGDAPAKGAHIDVVAHIGRFPQEGAVLTTGANTIYLRGHSIILGPHAVGPSALVHEFGHVLGFKDGYFRSYKDLGADGYEIIEVILDPETIVAAPEHGRVRREHFDQLLREKHP
jgi:hypothetical protein